jgi:Tol biopolymer transport system component
MIGKTIAQYKILDKLGEGGMGVVYKAEDTKLKRTVALKFLPAGLAASETDRERFVQEAQAASALDHPNVCIIHDIQEHEDQQFIVMGYVDGVTLREKLQEGQLELRELIDYGIQIGEALQEAHSKGIIHRDTKSDNIMVTTKNQIKVMDFGLARIKGALRKTQKTTTVGTLAYMSPEQLKGKDVDARADIFSFGVVLYEMLTGQLPFKGEYESALIYSVLNREPEPLARYRPELPSGFQNLLDKSLEKDLDVRYQSIGDLVVDLRRLRRDTSKAIRVPSEEFAAADEAPAPTAFTTPSEPAQRAISRSPLLYAVLIVILSLSGYFLLRGIGSSPVPRFTNPTKLSKVISAEDYPTWSPDGGMFAYHSNQNGNWDIWVTQVRGGSSVNRTSGYAGTDWFPSWSADGRQIAFWSERGGGGYFVMPVLGGSPRMVAAMNDFITAPQWSADGEKLVCVVKDSSGCYVEIISLQSGESRHLRLVGREGEQHELSWSPDGRYFVLVSSFSRLADVSQLWIMDSTDGNSFLISDGKGWDWNPTWLQDCKFLYFVSKRGGMKDLWRQQLAEDGSPRGSPQQLTKGREINYAMFSPDGKHLAYSKGGVVANVWRIPIPPMGTGPVTWEDARQLTFDQADHRALDYSPDQKKLVFHSDLDGQEHLWVMPVAGGELERLTINPMAQSCGKWSPNGQHIAFHSYPEEWGNVDIWIVPVAGGPARQVTRHEAKDMLPVWSPDGREIAFWSDRSGNMDIWIIPVEGGPARQVTDHPGVDWLPEWSPDGRWLIFWSDRNGVNQLWRIPATGGTPESLTGTIQGKGESIFSPDGKKVYFKAYRDAAWNLWEVSSKGGDERQLTNLRGKYGRIGERSATDGKYLYFTWHEDQSDIWVMDVEWE